MNKYRYLTTLCFAILFVPAFAETIYNGAVEADVAAWNEATAAKLTVAANDTVAITNGEFQLKAGVPSFGAGSTFEILDGAKLFATNSARQFALTADNSRIFMDAGYLSADIDDKYGLFSGTPKNCRWDLVNGSTVYMTGNYGYPHLSGSNNVICVVNSTNNFNNGDAGHIGRSMKFYEAEDCVWAFTNSYLESFLIGFGNPSEDTNIYYEAKFNGYARRNRLIFHNSKTDLYNTARGLHFGARNITNQSFSNRVEVTGTSGNLVLRRIQMRGFADLFRLEGGTVHIDGWRGGGLFMSGEFNRFENAGGTLTIGGNGVQLSNHGNVFLNCGGTLSKSATVGGVSNRIELTSGTISGDVTLNGTNGVFRLSGGLFKAALTMSGVSNVYEQVSGVSTGNVTVAGFGNTLYFRSGTHCGQYRRALVFNENTTNNTVVIDNAEFIHHGTFGKSYSGGEGYPYVNSPNCAIEFRGAAPKFRVTSPNQGASSTPSHCVNLGKGKEPLLDPVRLRFVLPETPYEDAPFRSEMSSSSYYAVLDGNAVIEVDDSNLPKSHGKLRYPLVYDTNAFHNGDRINVESLSTVNRALGTIGENMTFARDGKTLYVDIKSSGGFVLVVR